MLEKQFITKTYYRSLIHENDSRHPIEILGELFAEEEQKEFPDASEIRFAQGEVYFHNKDYEAAIFKWENVHNELEQWAKKNIADAYLELAIYPEAESIYQSINTESLTLRTEVLLQLFSLYIQQEKYQNANQMIKKMVKLNPDYPNVTKLARSFFEKQEDWQSALELAIQEGIRTENLSWFELLKAYIKNGHAKQQLPNFFFDALTVARKNAPDLFEQLVIALWNNYESEQEFFQWLKAFNTYLKNLGWEEEDYSYNFLSKKYKETYDELMGGSYSLKQLTNMIPDLLNAWIKIVGKEEEVLPSSAIFAWNEIVPDRFQADALKIAEKILFNAEVNVDVLEKSKDLNIVIDNWTDKHNLDHNIRIQALSRQLLDFHHQLTGVISFNHDTKTEFLNHFLQEEMVVRNNREGAVSIYKNSDEMKIIQYREYQEQELSLDQYMVSMEREKPAKICYEVNVPNQLLERNQLVIVELPELNRASGLTDAFIETMQILDSLLVVVDVNQGLPESRQKWIEMIQQQFPQLKTYFIQVGTDANEETKSYPGAEVFVYDYTIEHREKLADFLTTDWQQNKLVHQRMKKYLFLIQKKIRNLFDQRMKMKSQLEETIQSKQDLARKVNGAINQLEDLTVEKINMIRKSFILAKEETRKELVNDIPVILKATAKTITKKRDFQRIHIELNDEMNKKIETYLNEECMPKFLSRIRDWLVLCETELKDGKTFLDEIAEGFNSLIGFDRLQLPCDFMILEDWERDIDRLTSGVNYEPVNILLRYTPRQVLLKSAGKVFGKIIQNKEMLVNGFKQLIETGNYGPIVETIADRFFTPFHLIEQGIERDLRLFFKNAFEELKGLAEETDKEINEKTMELVEMKENPEAFRDPLKIFEITRLQYKYILEIDEMAYSQVNS
ncbi:hypothetical protein B4166_3708 [Caldibacillus thermoamylovorans]|uniref:GTP-binding protein n=1 Tax=Caldibacillus thermoamylovorans TaxID=35841 RepID=A0ABD4A937_9BACI|nr:hypothetical protein B4166_3708 [Caldibacillus thermoamylovorans]KIO72697.1 hypothetical protein B4167_2834 [Caldibacillus thermoamylovorans]